LTSLAIAISVPSLSEVPCFLIDRQSRH
jgi:hypothetical protein